MNQEKALIGAFSMIVNPIAADESFAALVARLAGHNANRAEQVPGCWAVYWCTVATLLHPPSHTLCSTHCNVQH